MPPDFVSFFVCNIEKPIACCVSAKKNYYNLTKSYMHFRQVSLKGVLLPVRLLEYFGEILQKHLWKSLNFTTHELLHKWFLRFPVRFFSPIYRSLFASYTADTFCIRIHICERYFFPLIPFLTCKVKEK